MRGLQSSHQQALRRATLVSHDTHLIKESSMRFELTAKLVSAWATVPAKTK